MIRYPLPLSCMHTHVAAIIDGHHKFIWWRMMTHCAIDGFSRLVVYIRCSNNNRPATVYDLLYRVCTSVKNVHVARHMLHHHRVERRSVLVSSSVHNQRIKRLWRDMHQCVTSTFYCLCYSKIINFSTHLILDTSMQFTMYTFFGSIGHWITFKKLGISTVREQNGVKLPISSSLQELCAFAIQG